MPTSATGLKGSETQAKIRLLLSLWDLKGLEESVKRSELNKRIVRSKERARDYQPIIDQLGEMGAIQQVTEGRSVFLKLTSQGLQVLRKELQAPDSDFEFSGTIVSTRFPNAILKLLRTTPIQESSNGAESVITAPLTAAVESAPKIETYEDFKTEVLQIYDQLNQGYNLQDLVPIYRIRRELRDRVPRIQFNEWLIKMQEDDIFQLMSGEVLDITPDKKEDSIMLPSGAFRYYAKRLL
jgi:hypothetical protein